MGEENLAAPVLHLGEVSELAAVVHSNGFKDLREVFSVLIMEGVCILSSKNPWFCQSKFLGIATGIPW